MANAVVFVPNCTTPPFDITFWLPEPPRWLIWDDQNARAWEVVQKIPHDPTDNQELAAQAEHIQIEKRVTFDEETKAGYIQILTIP